MGMDLHFLDSYLEIRDIYMMQIMELFKENVQEDGDILNCFNHKNSTIYPF